MKKVVIFGAGQIGRAVNQIILTLYKDVNSVVVDANPDNIGLIRHGGCRAHITTNLTSATHDEIVKLLLDEEAEYVINALHFSFNEKVASAAAAANCSYIDFTEDDVMADKVQKIFQSTNLDCAVKCGLAPGFINYIGYDLVGKIDTPDSLIISVGALPRNVSYDINHPEYSYNLTWSVDGLVNEYIRPCRIRRNGELMEVPALGNLTKVVLDGIEYEAAYTSGGVGSLARDLSNVPNVAYMTIRYPGHYRYIRSVVQDNHGNFKKIKKIFEEKFPFTDDDVIIVYANAHGKDENGKPVRRSYSNKFYGVDGLSGIQATTASSGVAMLELMIEGKVKGIINQTDVPLDAFASTLAVGKYYKTSK
jgi:saccharopine dehydrogenase-like NADP-dependent oxidoreductase